MITIDRKKGLFPYRIVWFCDKPYYQLWPVTVFYQSSHIPPVAGLIGQEFWSLTQQLNQSDNELLASMNGTTRLEIRQATKLNLQASWGNIKDFWNFFRLFVKKSNIRPVSQAQLRSFGKNLAITQVREPYSGQVLAMHAYLTDVVLARVRLLFSSSSCSKEIDKQLLGKANRFLHFWDMVEFRQKNFLIYDWGGIAKNTYDHKKEGINRFKQGFGGKEICEYHYYPFYVVGKRS